MYAVCILVWWRRVREVAVAVGVEMDGWEAIGSEGVESAAVGGWIEEEWGGGGGALRLWLQALSYPSPGQACKN